MRETLSDKRRRFAEIYTRLMRLYPNVGTFLTHRNAFELLVAVVLSAQCTDARVNQVTPALFAQFPTPEAFAAATPEEVVEPIRSVSFCFTKATHLVQLAQIILDRFSGEVPDTLEELTQLPGVGRKTANVILGQIFGKPGITVDTHVKRLSYRWAFTVSDSAEKVEQDLMKIWDESAWTPFSSVVILHGRNTCHARKPDCEHCILDDICPKKF